MTQQLSTWSLLTATAGLLAFLIGVYTLVSRDRKSPYLINSVFSVFLLSLVGAAIDIAAELVAADQSPEQDMFLSAGAGFLLLAIIVSAWRLWTIYVRFAYFVDPGGIARLKLVPIVRQVRAWSKGFGRSGPTYEHDPLSLSADLLTEIKEVIRQIANAPGAKDAQNVETAEKPATKGNFEVRDDKDPRSLAMALRHQGQANELLGNLCIAFLRQPAHYVQYMTASRHPIEFLTHLEAAVSARKDPKLEWKEVRRRLVAVDAYTPHFGFLDTINGDKTKRLRDQFGKMLLFSNETYAGLHSAASTAFKKLKAASTTSEEAKKASPVDSMRQPTLVIYEDMYALSDLESVEQYRIFARHVIPSERLWNGMFTVFVETAQQERDWELISSYASMTVDLRGNVTEPKVVVAPKS